MNKRKILVTSALPYANGDIHLGHLVEHIQTDIWVRFQRLNGHECYYICADDAHGTPVMLAAEKAGVSPQDFIASTRDNHLKNFQDFLIDYDHYSSTHTSENKQLVTDIFKRLQQAKMIEQRKIKQLYDPEKNMFLPDRFIQGQCPICDALDQYGDHCEACGATYDPCELKHPRSIISGAQPILKCTQHFFFTLSRCKAFLQQWTAGPDRLQREALNKMNEWLQGDLQDWDITRDKPYFGFEIPQAAGKYFYVWLDAPIGYMASFLQLCQKKNIDFEQFFVKESHAELHHFIGKDILYFHALFWPAILHEAGYRTPTHIHAHGFLTVNGKKMSKSRGTFITAKAYLDAGLDPEWLRYYLACKLSNKIEDLDLNWPGFYLKINGDLIGKYINIAARVAGFIHKRFSGKVLAITDSNLLTQLHNESVIIASSYEKKEFSQVLRIIMNLADQVNTYVDQYKPWELAKENSQKEKLHRVCSELIHAFRILTIYLAPILPRTAQKVAQFLNVSAFTWTDSTSSIEALSINPYTHLMTRVKEEQLSSLICEPEQSAISSYQE